MYTIRLIFPDSSPGFTRVHHNIDMAARHLLYHCIAFVFELKHWSHQLQEREDRTTVVKSSGFPPLHLSMYSMIQKGTHPQSQRIDERGESEDHFKKAVQAWMKLEMAKSHPQWRGSASMPCSGFPALPMESEFPDADHGNHCCCCAPGLRAKVLFARQSWWHLQDAKDALSFGYRWLQGWLLSEVNDVTVCDYDLFNSHLFNSIQSRSW